MVVETIDKEELAKKLEEFTYQDYLYVFDKLHLTGRYVSLRMKCES